MLETALEERKRKCGVLGGVLPAVVLLTVIQRTGHRNNGECNMRQGQTGENQRVRAEGRAIQTSADTR